MNRNQSRRLIAALGTGVVLALAAGAASFAATATRGLPANPSQQESQAPDRNQERPDARSPRDRGLAQRQGDRLERRLDFLHRQLNIRANQERVWNRFADAVRDEAQTLRDRFGELRERFRDRRDNGSRGRSERLPSVVERLERQQQILANRSERIEHLLNDIRPLYAALDPNQRRTADRFLFRPFAGGGPLFNQPVPGPGRLERRDFGNGYDAPQRRDTERGFNRDADPRNDRDNNSGTGGAGNGNGGNGDVDGSNGDANDQDIL